MTASPPEFRPLTHPELLAADPQITSWLVGRDGLSLTSTYPQVFGEGMADAYGAFNEGALCSHAAVRRVPLVTSTGWLRASLVGVVATDPEARGAQVASTMLHHIADQELECGQDIILLWSDLWEFYAKLGYVVGGVQAQVHYAPQNFGPASCRRVVPEDIPAMTAIHARKPWRVDRDEHEMNLLVRGTATDCFVSERDGEVVAYACHGKGLDFDGWWHEFGGTDADVAAMLPVAMHRIQQQSATILVPPYRHALLDRLTGQSTRVEEGIVALCKPLTELGRCEFFVDGLDSV